MFSLLEWNLQARLIERDAHLVALLGPGHDLLQQADMNGQQRQSKSTDSSDQGPMRRL